jgi:oligopeptide transport system permease protein
MIKYLIKKILILFFSLFIITTLTFFLMKAIPGDPFMQEKELPQEILDSLKAHFGQDRPIFLQYASYLKGFLTGDFGYSMVFEGQSVKKIIFESFPTSAILGLEAFFLSIMIGIPLGCFAAFRQNRWQDTFAMFIAILGISIPSFLLATFLQYFFGMKLSLLPIARWGTFAHTILPSFALAALPIAFLARLTRTNMIEVLKQDYIKTAYAKGLSPFQVIVKHALKNACLPSLTYLGPLLAHIVTGSFVIEKIFGIPGLGKWFVLSIANRDYPLIVGITLFYGTLLLSCVFLIDLLYALFDPRIKVWKKEDRYE